MNENFAIQLFEGKKVRFIWDEEAEKYYFAIVDIVQVLTESVDATAYWRKLKQRLKSEGNETVTSCHALKMPAGLGRSVISSERASDHIPRVENGNAEALDILPGEGV